MAMAVCSSVLKGDVNVESLRVKHKLDSRCDSCVVSRGLLAMCSPLLIGLSYK